MHHIELRAKNAGRNRRLPDAAAIVDTGQVSVRWVPLKKSQVVGSLLAIVIGACCLVIWARHHQQDRQHGLLRLLFGGAALVVAGVGLLVADVAVRARSRRRWPDTLLVMDRRGGLVATVHVAADCPFAERPGEAPGFVLGDFEPGPAFEPVDKMLGEFNAVFATGDMDAAARSSEGLDAIGLVAVDDHGRLHRVSNIVFQRAGLLFCAT